MGIERIKCEHLAFSIWPLRIVFHAGENSWPESKGSYFTKGPQPQFLLCKGKRLAEELVAAKEKLAQSEPYFFSSQDGFSKWFILQNIYVYTL